MTDYNALLAASRRKLCQIRDRRKVMQDVSHDQFYYSVSEILRIRFGAKVSFGWVRAQCLSETDPSFLRFGALLNFLEDYDEDGIQISGESPALVPETDLAPSVEEEVPDLDNINPYFEDLRKQHVRGGKSMPKPRLKSLLR